MTVNVSLLQATLARIKEEGHHWNQGSYRRTIDPEKPASPCNTSMCFAGWAVTIDGGEWWPDGFYREMLRALPDEEYDAKVQDVPLVHVRDRAIRVLGLTHGDANYLFSPEHTIEDLERIVAELIGDAK